MWLSTTPTAPFWLRWLPVGLLLAALGFDIFVATSPCGSNTVDALFRLWFIGVPFLMLVSLLVPLSTGTSRIGRGPWLAMWLLWFVVGAIWFVAWFHLFACSE